RFKITAQQHDVDPPVARPTLRRLIGRDGPVFAVTYSRKPRWVDAAYVDEKAHHARCPRGRQFPVGWVNGIMDGDVVGVALNPDGMWQLLELGCQGLQHMDGLRLQLGLPGIE